MQCRGVLRVVDIPFADTEVDPQGPCYQRDFPVAVDKVVDFLVV